jgi:hypothetical protein
MAGSVRSMWHRGRAVAALVAAGMVIAVAGVVASPAVAEPLGDVQPAGLIKPYFGYWVSVSGNTAMVGTPFDAGGKGSVHVYTLTTGTWVETAVLHPSDPAPHDAFGRSVVIRGTTAVVGAVFKTAPNGSLLAGAAYVYELIGGVWTEQAKLLPPVSGSNANFGRGIAMSVSATTILVGAPGTATNTGAAYVYVKSAGTWTYQATLRASDRARHDNFGKHVSIDGSTAVVGAPAHNATAGAAYVFTQTGTKWTQQAELAGADTIVGDNFGRSVSLFGSSVLIGANREPPVVGKGAAYVFSFVGGVWVQDAKLVPSDSMDGDNFGRSVALQGNTAVIGAPFKNKGKGGAYVFTLSGGVWTQAASLKADNTVGRDDFGRTVAIDGTLAVFGAPNKYLHDGAAYIFTGSGSTWTQMVELPAMRTS